MIPYVVFAAADAVDWYDDPRAVVIISIAAIIGIIVLVALLFRRDVTTSIGSKLVNLQLAVGSPEHEAEQHDRSLHRRLDGYEGQLRALTSEVAQSVTREEFETFVDANEQRRAVGVEETRAYVDEVIAPIVDAIGDHSFRLDKHDAALEALTKEKTP